MSTNTIVIISLWSLCLFLAIIMIILCIIFCISKRHKRPDKLSTKAKRNKKRQEEEEIHAKNSIELVKKFTSKNPISQVVENQSELDDEIKMNYCRKANEPFWVEIIYKDGRKLRFDEYKLNEEGKKANVFKKGVVDRIDEEMGIDPKSESKDITKFIGSHAIQERLRKIMSITGGEYKIAVKHFYLKAHIGDQNVAMECLKKFHIFFKDYVNAKILTISMYYIMLCSKAFKFFDFGQQTFINLEFVVSEFDSLVPEQTKILLAILIEKIPKNPMIKSVKFYLNSEESIESSQETLLPIVRAIISAFDITKEPDKFVKTIEVRDFKGLKKLAEYYSEIIDRDNHNRNLYRQHHPEKKRWVLQIIKTRNTILFNPVEHNPMFETFGMKKKKKLFKSENTNLSTKTARLNTESKTERVEPATKSESKTEPLESTTASLESTSELESSNSLSSEDNEK